MPLPRLDENWLLWRDSDHSPAFNMAADTLLLQTMPELKHPILRLYGWNERAVSIGFAQTWGITPSGYKAVRRPTGGGVVFHDIDQTYTLVFPAGHFMTECSREESYAIIHESLANAMSAQGQCASLLSSEIKSEDHARMQCFISPSKNDVMLNGEKFAGAAQRRSREGVLHQGSIKRILSGGDTERLAQLIEHAFTVGFGISYTPWTPSPEFLHAAKSLAHTQFESESWSLKRRTGL